MNFSLKAPDLFCGLPTKRIELALFSSKEQYKFEHLSSSKQAY